MTAFTFTPAYPCAPRVHTGFAPGPGGPRRPAGTRLHSPGIAGGIPYIAFVLVGLWGPWRRYIFVLAALASVLSVLGYFLSPPGSEHWMVLVNRGLALFAIWAVAFLGDR